jgi:hypothetical protein
VLRAPLPRAHFSKRLGELAQDGVEKEGLVEGLISPTHAPTMSHSIWNTWANQIVWIQVIILGDSGVGKTSLMNQYVRTHRRTHRAAAHREVPADEVFGDLGQQEVQR